MPLIRCPKCGQAYDVPGVVAVRLPNAIATCHCGEWLSGSKAAVLARIMNPDQIKEIDLQPYRVDAPAPQADVKTATAPSAPPAAPRSIRIIARGAVDKVFTISDEPLWIGRKGCHVDLPDAELDLRHCSIAVVGSQLVLRDADSHKGTFLDGQKVSGDVVIADGMHLLRAGNALLTVEPTTETGTPVKHVELGTSEIVRDEAEIEAMRTRPIKSMSQPLRPMLVCIDGPLLGQEFEIPPTGLVVGREGHVRVPDEYLSRKHFEVAVDADGTIRVRDLGSRNGTFLNTLPAHNTKVQSGDEIRAGVHRFRVEHRA